MASSAARLLDESDEEHEAWLDVWVRLELHDLPGFPRWEAEVHGELQLVWKGLLSVYAHFCKHTSVATASAAEHGLRLTAAGWVAMLKECGLSTKHCPEFAMLHLFSDAAVDQVAKLAASGEARQRGTPTSARRSNSRCCPARLAPGWGTGYGPSGSLRGPHSS